MSDPTVRLGELKYRVGERVGFEAPGNEGAVLVVWKKHVGASEGEKLLETLLLQCEQCGPIFRAVSRQYSIYIRFFTAHAANLCCESIHGSIFEGTQVSVRMKSSKRRYSYEKKPLALRHCISLANFYLGFNGWSLDSHVKMLAKALVVSASVTFHHRTTREITGRHSATKAILLDDKVTLSKENQVKCVVTEVYALLFSELQLIHVKGSYRAALKMSSIPDCDEAVYVRTMLR